MDAAVVADIRYGPLTVEHRKRPQTQRQRRREAAPETRPEEVQATQKKDAPKDDTLSYVRSVSEASSSEIS